MLRLKLARRLKPKLASRQNRVSAQTWRGVRREMPRWTRGDRALDIQSRAFKNLIPSFLQNWSKCFIDTYVYFELKYELWVRSELNVEVSSGTERFYIPR